METHKDPITGAVCAHSDSTVWRLYWLGPGADQIRISGHCMNEPGLGTVADGLSAVTSAAQFRAVAKAFFAEGETV